MGSELAILPNDKPVIPKKARKALTRDDRLFILAYTQSRTLLETGHAYAKLRNTSYATDESAATCACQKLHQIRAKIEATGNPEEWWEMLGLGSNRIARAIGDGMDATSVKPMTVRQSRVVEWVDADSGKIKRRVVDEDLIAEAGPYIDHPTRVDAAVAAAKLRGDIRRADPTIKAGVEKDGFRFIFMMEPSK